MRRGDFFRVAHPSSRDPKKSRVFVIVSRQALIDSRFSTVVCAPVYTERHGLSSEVPVGVDEGLKHDSGIYCDGLVSLDKSLLTNFIGTLPSDKMPALEAALRIALDLAD